MNSAHQSLKYIFFDLIAAAVGWCAFYTCRYDWTGYQDFDTLGQFLTSGPVLLNLCVSPFIWLSIFAVSGYYQQPFFKSRLDELRTTFASVFFGTMLFYFSIVIDDVPLLDDQLMQLIKVVHVSRNTYIQILVTMFGCVFTPVYLCRFFITHTANEAIKNGRAGLRTLVIGNGKAAAHLYKALRSNKQKSGYLLTGCVNSGCDKSKALTELADFGSIEDIKEVLADHHIEAFILAPDLHTPKIICQLIYTLMPYDLPIRLRASEEDIISGKVHTNSLTTIPMEELGVSHLSPFQRNMKRLEDIVLSMLALLILSPFLLVLYIIIAAESNGPVFFKQERIGRLGHPFTMYKFRSMKMDAENNGPQLSTNNDPRITPIGRFLRKYRIDELPQFWNVLKGDMSIVGPRPERCHYINQIMKIAPYYSKLLQIKPGITSWGMVKYGYASNVFQMVERMRYDLMYLDNCSTSMDIKIFCYTIRTVVTGKGI